MAAIEDIRNAGEADLTRRLQKINKKYRKRIRAAIAEYGSLGAIPDSFWQEMEREINSESTAAMLLILIAAYDSTSNRLGLRAEEQRTRQEAEQITRQRGEVLARGEVASIRRRLQDTITKQRTLPTTPTTPISIPTRDIDIITPETIEDILSDQRAERAGTTETTGAISSGQRGGRDDFEQADPLNTTVMIWRTERDARVCPICSPLDGKTDKVWSQQFPSGPPAHINCRCELVVNGKRGRLSALTDELIGT